MLTSISSLYFYILPFIYPTHTDIMLHLILLRTTDPTVLCSRKQLRMHSHLIFLRILRYEPNLLDFSNRTFGSSSLSLAVWLYAHSFVRKIDSRLHRREFKIFVQRHQTLDTINFSSFHWRFIYILIIKPIKIACYIYKILSCYCTMSNYCFVLTNWLFDHFHVERFQWKWKTRKYNKTTEQ